uniref:Uncharacterized protein n=1 Tax=Glossina austeni TaxID=7395 RepID=A0A1A9VUJ1_GLOAU
MSRERSLIARLTEYRLLSKTKQRNVNCRKAMPNLTPSSLLANVAGAVRARLQLSAATASSRGYAIHMLFTYLCTLNSAALVLNLNAKSAISRKQYVLQAIWKILNVVHLAVEVRDIGVYLATVDLFMSASICNEAKL